MTTLVYHKRPSSRPSTRVWRVGKINQELRRASKIPASTLTATNYQFSEKTFNKSTLSGTPPLSLSSRVPLSERVRCILMDMFCHNNYLAFMRSSHFNLVVIRGFHYFRLYNILHPYITNYPGLPDNAIDLIQPITLGRILGG